MNSISVRSSANRTSFNITIGCREGWSKNRLWKYDEQAERTTCTKHYGNKMQTKFREEEKGEKKNIHIRQLVDRGFNKLRK